MTKQFHFKLILFFAFTISSSLSIVARDFSGVQIKTHKITENIYMLNGAGGNIGVITGVDGVLMVDDQFAPLSEKIKTAISRISEKPIKFVINTHWHRDHSQGNENFARAGAIIVAHQNTRKRMSAEQFVKAFKRTVPASPNEALPVVTFATDITFHLNGEQIEAMHVKNAHTDGDVVIFFKTSNVIHMGDTYFSGQYPFIDYSTGGG